MALTPDQRAHWDNYVRHLRDFWEGPHPDNPTDQDDLEELAEIAVSDHLVALEAQVAEARRLIALTIIGDDACDYVLCEGGRAFLAATVGSE